MSEEQVELRANSRVRQLQKLLTDLGFKDVMEVAGDAGYTLIYEKLFLKDGSWAEVTINVAHEAPVADETDTEETE